MILGYLLLGLQPLPVAWLVGAHFGAPATVFARFSFALSCIALICLLRRRGLRTKNPRLLLFRGLFGGAAVMLYFFSIQNAGAARGTLLNYTYPMWANLFAWMLGEKPRPSFFWTLSLALTGVVLVIRPQAGWGETSLGLGELAGIASAMCAGAAVLTVKKLRKTDESLTIIMSFSVVGLILSVPLLDFGHAYAVLEQPSVRWAVISVGALSFCGHLLFTRGYRGVSLAQGTLLSLLVPVVAGVGGIVLLGEEFSWSFLLGALLVLASLTVPTLLRRVKHAAA